MAAEALVLPTSYAAIHALLLPAVRASTPDAILLLGVAPRRREVCVERQAANRVSRLFPDASGAVGRQLALAPGRPLRLPSRAPLGTLLRHLRAAGVPARMSRDAGRYLCNAAYFTALDDAGPDRPPVAFIHVPMPRGDRPGDRRPSLLGMTQALTEAALALSPRGAAPPRRGPRPPRCRSS